MQIIRSRAFTADRAWGALSIATMNGITTRVHRTARRGDIFFAQAGCEHVAHPRGEARVLVVEREGSV